MKQSVTIDGRDLPLTIKINKRAKRFILRMDPKTGGVKVTMPPLGDLDDAIEMVHKHQVWISNQLISKPECEKVEPGSILLFQGIETPVHHDEQRRGTVYFEQDRIVVCGQRAFFDRRLKDGLKKQARNVISELAHEMADQINKPIHKIVLRDTVSRWGSCTSKGGLNFNWRLILAPPHILRYVVAHEVSHLREMNHSPAFWAIVAKLHPQYKRDRNWLKKNGTRLMGYQFSSENN